MDKEEKKMPKELQDMLMKAGINSDESSGKDDGKSDAFKMVKSVLGDQFEGAFQDVKNYLKEHLPTTPVSSLSDVEKALITGFLIAGIGTDMLGPHQLKTRASILVGDAILRMAVDFEISDQQFQHFVAAVLPVILQHREELGF